MFRSKKAKAEDLMANGSKAVGTLTGVADTGMTINDNPRVKLTFRIDPLDGSPPFEAQKTATVSRVQIPQPGARYPVWYDPSDTNKVAYAAGIADENGRAQIVALFGDAFGPDGSGIGMPAAPAGAAAPSNDAVDQIRKLAELRDAGILSEAEFAEKKAQLLAQM